jgi:hypothetical protein
VPNLTRRDLRSFLPQYDLPDEQVDMVILLVRGWLLDATELLELPDPLPEGLWAGAVELAALLASNPESLAQKTIGPTSRSWPMSPQRDRILNSTLPPRATPSPPGTTTPGGTTPRAPGGGTGEHQAR